MKFDVISLSDQSHNDEKWKGFVRCPVSGDSRVAAPVYSQLLFSRKRPSASHSNSETRFYFPC
jgi:hypothetical protein